MLDSYLIQSTEKSEKTPYFLLRCLLQTRKKSRARIEVNTCPSVCDSHTHTLHRCCVNVTVVQREKKPQQ